MTSDSKNPPLWAVLLIGVFILGLVVLGEWVKASIWASAWGR